MRLSATSLCSFFLLLAAFLITANFFLDIAILPHFIEKKIEKEHVHADALVPVMDMNDEDHLPALMAEKPGVFSFVGKPEGLRAFTETGEDTDEIISVALTSAFVDSNSDTKSSWNMEVLQINGQVIGYVSLIGIDEQNSSIEAVPNAFSGSNDDDDDDYFPARTCRRKRMDQYIEENVPECGLLPSDKRTKAVSTYKSCYFGNLVGINMRFARWPFDVNGFANFRDDMRICGNLIVDGNININGSVVNINPVQECDASQYCGVPNDCQQYICLEFVLTNETLCLATAADEGLQCNDKNSFTSNDTCVAGMCMGTASERNAVEVCSEAEATFCSPPQCQKLDICLISDEEKNCIYGANVTLNGTPCDDFKNNTFGDQCVDGQCIGTAQETASVCSATQQMTCDSLQPNECTQIECVSVENQAMCLLVPADEGLQCNDKNPFTSNDVCISGMCMGDAIQITDAPTPAPLPPDAQSCDAAVHCHPPGECRLVKCILFASGQIKCLDNANYTLDGTECNDNDPDTSNDVCVAGVCEGEVVTPSPSAAPTLSPSASPTNSPTKSPSQSPTLSPSQSPTESPTEAPTPSPTPTPCETEQGCPHSQIQINNTEITGSLHCGTAGDENQTIPSTSSDQGYARCYNLEQEEVYGNLTIEAVGFLVHSANNDNILVRLNIYTIGSCSDITQQPVTQSANLVAYEEFEMGIGDGGAEIVVVMNETVIIMEGLDYIVEIEQVEDGYVVDEFGDLIPEDAFGFYVGNVDGVEFCQDGFSYIRLAPCGIADWIAFETIGFSHRVLWQRIYCDMKAPAPTPKPTSLPTPAPSQSPTAEPTKSPSQSPTSEPTPSPVESPTGSPSASPTNSPSESPTAEPTPSPVNAPTASPSESPTAEPTPSPVESPTGSPTNSPTLSPTPSPTVTPCDTEQQCPHSQTQINNTDIFPTLSCGNFQVEPKGTTSQGYARCYNLQQEGIFTDEIIEAVGFIVRTASEDNIVVRINIYTVPVVEGGCSSVTSKPVTENITLIAYEEFEIGIGDIGSEIVVPFNETVLIEQGNDYVVEIEQVEGGFFDVGHTDNFAFNPASVSGAEPFCYDGYSYWRALDCEYDDWRTLESLGYEAYQVYQIIYCDMMAPAPTPKPTSWPTRAPTGSPTAEPTKSPTGSPTSEPTPSPVNAPTASPSASPTLSPSQSPSASPTLSPTSSPTASPTPSCDTLQGCPHSQTELGNMNLAGSYVSCSNPGTTTAWARCYNLQREGIFTDEIIEAVGFIPLVLSFDQNFVIPYRINIYTVPLAEGGCSNITSRPETENATLIAYTEITVGTGNNGVEIIVPIANATVLQGEDYIVEIEVTQISSLSVSAPNFVSGSSFCSVGETYMRENCSSSPSDWYIFSQYPDQLYQVIYCDMMAPPPTPKPTLFPTPLPTAQPTPSPTLSPSASPSASPTENPSASPTMSPSASPSASPTLSPTVSPTPSPTMFDDECANTEPDLETGTCNATCSSHEIELVEDELAANVTGCGCACFAANSSASPFDLSEPVGQCDFVLSEFIAETPLRIETQNFFDPNVSCCTGDLLNNDGPETPLGGCDDDICAEQVCHHYPECCDASGDVEMNIWIDACVLAATYMCSCGLENPSSDVDLVVRNIAVVDNTLPIGVDLHQRVSADLCNDGSAAADLTGDGIYVYMYLTRSTPGAALAPTDYLDFFADEGANTGCLVENIYFPSASPSCAIVEKVSGFSLAAGQCVQIVGQKSFPSIQFMSVGYTTSATPRPLGLRTLHFLIDSQPNPYTSQLNAINPVSETNVTNNVAYVQVNVVLQKRTFYKEDFSSGTAGWLPIPHELDQSNFDLYWNYVDGAWKCKDISLDGYGNEWNQWLRSPVIDLSASETQGYDVVFFIYGLINVESYNDYLYVDISTDNFTTPENTITNVLNFGFTDTDSNPATINQITNVGYLLPLDFGDTQLQNYQIQLRFDSDQLASDEDGDWITSLNAAVQLDAFGLALYNSTTEEVIDNDFFLFYDFSEGAQNWTPLKYELPPNLPQAHLERKPLCRTVATDDHDVPDCSRFENGKPARLCNTWVTYNETYQYPHSVDAVKHDPIWQIYNQVYFGIESPDIQLPDPNTLSPGAQIFVSFADKRNEIYSVTGILNQFSIVDDQTSPLNQFLWFSSGSKDFVSRRYFPSRYNSNDQFVNQMLYMTQSNSTMRLRQVFSDGVGIGFGSVSNPADTRGLFFDSVRVEIYDDKWGESEDDNWPAICDDQCGSLQLEPRCSCIPAPPPPSTPIPPPVLPGPCITLDNCTHSQMNVDVVSRSWCGSCTQEDAEENGWSNQGIAWARCYNLEQEGLVGGTNISAVAVRFAYWGSIDFQKEVDVAVNIYFDTGFTCPPTETSLVTKQYVQTANVTYADQIEPYIIVLDEPIFVPPGADYVVEFELLNSENQLDLLNINEQFHAIGNWPDWDDNLCETNTSYWRGECLTLGLPNSRWRAHDSVNCGNFGTLWQVVYCDVDEIGSLTPPPTPQPTPLPSVPRICPDTPQGCPHSQTSQQAIDDEVFVIGGVCADQRWARCYNLEDEGFIGDLTIEQVSFIVYSAQTDDITVRVNIYANDTSLCSAFEDGSATRLNTDLVAYEEFFVGIGDIGAELVVDFNVTIFEGQDYIVEIEMFAAANTFRPAFIDISNYCQNGIQRISCNSAPNWPFDPFTGSLYQKIWCEGVTLPPTPEPTPPTPNPTPLPTEQPTPSPVESPTASPTNSPTPSPTETPCLTAQDCPHDQIETGTVPTIDADELNGLPAWARCYNATQEGVTGSPVIINAVSFWPSSTTVSSFVGSFSIYIYALESLCDDVIGNFVNEGTPWTLTTMDTYTFTGSETDAEILVQVEHVIPPDNDYLIFITTSDGYGVKNFDLAQNCQSHPTYFYDMFTGPGNLLSTYSSGLYQRVYCNGAQQPTPLPTPAPTQIPPTPMPSSSPTTCLTNQDCPVHDQMDVGLLNPVNPDNLDAPTYSILPAWARCYDQQDEEILSVGVTIEEVSFWFNAIEPANLLNVSIYSAPHLCSQMLSSPITSALLPDYTKQVDFTSAVPNTEFVIDISPDFVVPSTDDYIVELAYTFRAVGKTPPPPTNLVHFDSGQNCESRPSYFRSQTIDWQFFNTSGYYVDEALWQKIYCPGAPTSAPTNSPTPSPTSLEQLCCTESSEPGCEDQTCVDAVCEFDTTCCTQQWHMGCVWFANRICNMNTSTCVYDEHCSDCWLTDSNPAKVRPGCGQQHLRNLVCDGNQDCCDVEWDEFCVNVLFDIIDDEYPLINGTADRELLEHQSCWYTPNCPATEPGCPYSHTSLPIGSHSTVRCADGRNRWARCYDAVQTDTFAQEIEGVGLLFENPFGDDFPFRVRVHFLNDTCAAPSTDQILSTPIDMVVFVPNTLGVSALYNIPFDPPLLLSTSYYMIEVESDAWVAQHTGVEYLQCADNEQSYVIGPQCGANDWISFGDACGPTCDSIKLHQRVYCNDTFPTLNVLDNNCDNGHQSWLAYETGILNATSCFYPFDQCENGIRVSAYGGSPNNDRENFGFWQIRNNAQDSVLSITKAWLTFAMPGVINRDIDRFFAPDVFGLNDVASGGDSPVTGCGGTYRLNSDVDTGLLYDESDQRTVFSDCCELGAYNATSGQFGTMVRTTAGCDNHGCLDELYTGNPITTACRTSWSQTCVDRVTTGKDTPLDTADRRACPNVCPKAWKPPCDSSSVSGFLGLLRATGNRYSILQGGAAEDEYFKTLQFSYANGVFFDSKTFQFDMDVAYNYFFQAGGTMQGMRVVLELTNDRLVMGTLERKSSFLSEVCIRPEADCLVAVNRPAYNFPFQPEEWDDFSIHVLNPNEAHYSQVFGSPTMRAIMYDGLLRDFRFDGTIFDNGEIFDPIYPRIYLEQDPMSGAYIEEFDVEERVLCGRPDNTINFFKPGDIRATLPGGKTAILITTTASAEFRIPARHMQGDQDTGGSCEDADSKAVNYGTDVYDGVPLITGGLSVWTGFYTTDTSVDYCIITTCRPTTVDIQTLVRVFDNFGDADAVGGGNIGSVDILPENELAGSLRGGGCPNHGFVVLENIVHDQVYHVEISFQDVYNPVVNYPRNNVTLAISCGATPYTTVQTDVVDGYNVSSRNLIAHCDLGPSGSPTPSPTSSPIAAPSAVEQLNIWNSAICPALLGTTTFCSHECTPIDPLTCSGGKIVSVDWVAASLPGSLATEFGQLTGLETIDLSLNSLQGTIPSEMGNLAALQILSLNNNGLSGTIPAELASPASFAELRLQNNELRGHVPQELTSKTTWTTLALLNTPGGNVVDNNCFGCVVPPVQSGNIAAYDLSKNCVPVTLFDPSTFDQGSLRPHCVFSEMQLWNEFICPALIPQTVPCVDTCASAHLTCQPNGEHISGVNWFNANLQGTIPPSLWLLRYSITFKLDGNSLSGSIPELMPGNTGSNGYLSSLDVIDFSYNVLSNVIPSKIGLLTGLQILYLQNNQLSSSTPSELGLLTGLQRMYLDNNQLIGQMPAQLGQATSLTHLYLDNNQLSGTIPSEFGLLIAMQDLRLYSNQLSGPVSVYLNNMTSMSTIALLLRTPNGAVDDQNCYDCPLPTLETAFFLGGYDLALNCLPDNTTQHCFECEIPKGCPEHRQMSYYENTDLTFGFSPSFDLNSWARCYNLEEEGFLPGEPMGIHDVKFLTDVTFVPIPELSINIYTSPTPICSLNISQSSVTLAASITYVSISFTGVALFTTVFSPPVIIAPGHDYIVAIEASEASLNYFAPTHIETTSYTTCNDKPSYLSWDGGNWLSYGPGSLYTGDTEVLYQEIGCEKVLDIELWNLFICPALTPQVGDCVDSCADAHLTCSGNDITKILANAKGYAGTIPPEIALLTSLDVVDLNSNSLMGTIPSEIALLTSLFVLDLNNNILSGTIPSEIGNLGSLQGLILYGNQLNGTIPSELGNLGILFWLYLHENQLSGTIPSELGNLGILNSFYLHGNQLSGTIPSHLANMPLTYLSLGDNALMGPIPSELGSVGSLQYLWLYENDLNGTIPPELGNLDILLWFYLHDNQLSGTIPPQLGNLTSLQRLVLYDNQLSGTIPLQISNLGSLQTLSLENNQLEGDVPAIWISTALTNVDLLYTPSGIVDDQNCYNCPLPGLDQTIFGAGSDYDVFKNCLAPANMTRHCAQPTSSPTQSPSQSPTTSPTLSPTLSPVASPTRSPTMAVPTSSPTLSPTSSPSASPTPQPTTIASLSDVEIWNNYIQPALSNTAGPAMDSCNTPPLTCSAEKITVISANGYGSYIGSIPTEIGLLTALTRFELFSNSLTGTIPTEIGQLTGLTSRLWMDGNQLTGPIPTEIGQLTGLTSLFLNANQLTGPIPTEIGQLTSAIGIHLYSNQLSGAIPTEISQLTSLDMIGGAQWLLTNGASNTINVFEKNCFNCPLPVPLPAPFTFSSYNLSKNCLPVTGLPHCASTDQLDFWNNEIQPFVSTGAAGKGTDTCGVAPLLECDSEGNLLDISANGIGYSGYIPTTIGQLQGTKSLFLANMAGLSGILPTELANITSLEVLVTGANVISGTIPSQFENLQNLVELTIALTDLSGTIPTQIAGMTSLQFLRLFSNKLSGTIPPQLGNLGPLQYLSLQYNRLEGPIPSDLGLLTIMTKLELQSNQLSGPIPVEIGLITTLQISYLFSNLLSGPIPTEIGLITALQIFSLSDNLLNGQIPTEIGLITTLQELYLHTNALTGTIPSETINLASLEILFLNNNALSGTIPIELAIQGSLVQLRLQSNQLSGEIPSDIGTLANLQELWLNDNALIGTIPLEIAALTLLETVYLELNQLGGVVPDFSAATLTLTGVDLLNTPGGFVSDNNCFVCPLPALNPAIFGGSVDYDVSKNCLTAIDIIPHCAATNEEWWNGDICPALKATPTTSCSDFCGAVPHLSCSVNEITDVSWNPSPNLAGSLSPHIGKLEKLQYLSINEDLTGTIPPSISTLSHLFWLEMHSNVFTGIIPTEVGLMQNLTMLSVFNNDLSGPIPSELGQLTALATLFLHNNALSDAIPIEVANIAAPSLIQAFLLNTVGGSSVEGTEVNCFTCPLPQTLLPVFSADSDFNLLLNCDTMTGQSHCGVPFTPAPTPMPTTP